MAVQISLTSGHVFDELAADTISPEVLNKMFENGFAYIVWAQTEGMQTIVVPPSAIVVSFTGTTRDKLTPGAPVFLLAVDGEDGSVTSPAIVVGQNGVEPPM